MSSERFLRIQLPLLLVPSGSVKENRAACPSGLALELTGLPVRPVVLSVTGEGYSWTEVVHGDTVLVLPVPRGGTFCLKRSIFMRSGAECCTNSAKEE